MRWIGILIAVLVLLSVPAYAQVGAMRTGVRAKTGPAAVAAPGSVPRFDRMTPEQREQYRERIMQMLVKQFGEEKVREMQRKGIKLEDIVGKVMEKRERAAKGSVVVSQDQIRKFQEISNRYRKIVEKIRETKQKYVKRYQEWARYRKMYENGEIDENTYFNITKDFILTALDTTIARLEAAKSHMEDKDLNTDLNTEGIENAIARLQEIRADVEAATTLEELRAIYKEEVLPAIREYHDKMFTRAYVLMTVRASQSIVVRLDAAAARLTRYVELAKEKGIYDEEMEERVNAIFANIEAVKAELNALEAEVKAGDIESVKEYMEELKGIKEDVVDIYKEIRDLIADYNKHFAERVRQRVREEREEHREEMNATEEEEQEEVNASTGEEENEEVEQETEVEENTTVETSEEIESNTTVESNTTAETGEETTTVEQPEEGGETNTGGSTSTETNITEEEQNTSVEANTSVEVNA